MQSDDAMVAARHPQCLHACAPGAFTVRYYMCTALSALFTTGPLTFCVLLQPTAPVVVVLVGLGNKVSLRYRTQHCCWAAEVSENSRLFQTVK